MSSTVPIPVVLLLLSLLAGCAPLGPTSTAPLCREAAATFDDPVKAFETHLSGSIDEFNSGKRDRIDLLHQPDLGATRGCLELAYRMGATRGPTSPRASA